MGLVGATGGFMGGFVYSLKINRIQGVKLNLATPRADFRLWTANLGDAEYLNPLVKNV